MCKMMAKKAGKDDAWLVEDGFVTEGTSNNAWIVTARRRARHPRPLDARSCTASPAPRCWPSPREAQIRVEERPFTIAEAHERGRGLHHRRLRLRDPGGRDRRQAGRRRPARPGHPPPARALPRREPGARHLSSGGPDDRRPRDPGLLRRADQHGELPGLRPRERRGAVIDPVLDFDHRSGEGVHASADEDPRGRRGGGADASTGCWRPTPTPTTFRPRPT